MNVSYLYGLIFAIPRAKNGNNLTLTFVNVIIGTKMTTASRKHRICHLQFLDNTDEIGL